MVLPERYSRSLFTIPEGGVKNGYFTPIGEENDPFLGLLRPGTYLIP